MGEILNLTLVPFSCLGDSTISAALSMSGPTGSFGLGAVNLPLVEAMYKFNSLSFTTAFSRSTLEGNLPVSNSILNNATKCIQIIAKPRVKIIFNII